VVSRWNNTLLFQPAPGVLRDDQPLPVCRTASGGKNTFGSDVPIQITMPASPLVAGLNSPFSMADGSEFVYELTGLGPEWTVAATFDGGGTTYPAVLSAVRSGGGCVALSPFDYFDARNAGEVPKATWNATQQYGCLGRAQPVVAAEPCRQRCNRCRRWRPRCWPCWPV
jgi:hypothetical protein